MSVEASSVRRLDLEVFSFAWGMSSVEMGAFSSAAGPLLRLLATLSVLAFTVRTLGAAPRILGA